MANPTTPGRMLNQSISRSVRFAQLSPDAQRLFVLIIPHLNSHGKFHGDPNVVKGIVCPLLADLTPENLPGLLAEISLKTNIKWWKDKDGIYWIHALQFHQEQSLRLDRLGRDCYPSWPSEKPSVPDYSGTSPGKVPLKLREVKGREVKKISFSPSERRGSKGSEKGEGDRASSPLNGNLSQEKTPLAGAPIPPSAEAIAKPKKPRTADPIWDALCEAFGLKPATEAENKRIGAVVRDLKKKGATPEVIRQAYAKAQEKGWNDLSLEGLVTRLDQLTREQPKVKAAAAPVFTPGFR